MKEAEPDRKGWYRSRGLPHRDELHLIQAVTFRLVDSLPQSVVELLRQTLPERSGDRAYQKRIERILDEGQGEASLQRPEVARIVTRGILRTHEEDSFVFAFVVMPTHVHFLTKPKEGVALGQAVGRLKGRTSREVNLLLGRSGAFWAADYFDRFIRNEAHFRSCVDYIHQNPVKAKLCLAAEDWPWSSARETGG